MSSFTMVTETDLDVTPGSKVTISVIGSKSWSAATQKHTRPNEREAMGNV